MRAIENEQADLSLALLGLLDHLARCIIAFGKWRSTAPAPQIFTLQAQTYYSSGKKV